MSSHNCLIINNLVRKVKRGSLSLLSLFEFLYCLKGGLNYVYRGEYSLSLFRLNLTYHTKQYIIHLLEFVWH